jgi:predicted nucleic acid-binding protein
MSVPLLVADSGPLIALARLDLLHLPSRLFTEVLVTATVWDEVVRDPRPAEQSPLHGALRAGWLTVVPGHVVWPAGHPVPVLDAGEVSAIALAHARGAAVLLDERRGRAAATALGLQVLGTLGLLVRARDAGLVPRVRPLADALTAGGYFLAPALVERLLADIGE